MEKTLELKSIPERLNPSQNLLDQEPFASIINKAVEQRYSVENRKVIARCFIVNFARKFPALVREIKGMESAERAAFLDTVTGQFWKRLQISILKQGFPENMFFDLASASGNFEGQQLLVQLITSLCEHSGWDNYIRQFGESFRRTGERLKNKASIKVPTFSFWENDQG